MLKRSRKQNAQDENQIAFGIVNKAASQNLSVNPQNALKKEKNPYAVALGRLGGLKGGKARAERLSSKKRRQIAKKAAKIRWEKFNKS